MSRPRPEAKPWSALTKGTWSIGLGVAGLVIVACALLALYFGYLARREGAEGDIARAVSRGTLGMMLGGVGVITSIAWMALVGGLF